MSGLFGLAMAGGAPVDPEGLAAMGRAVQAVPAGEAAPGAPAPELLLDHAGSVGLGVAGFPGVRSAIVRRQRPAGTLVVAFHGSLFDGPERSPGTDPAAWIANRYDREGLDFLKSARGDFVVAIWDEARDSLLLATDPFRVESLVYAVQDAGLAFASHMRGLLAAPLVIDRGVHPSSVLDLIASSYIPTPRTIFRAVRKLPPGSSLCWKGGEARVETYWDMDYRNEDPSPEPVLARRLKERMDQALASRLAEEGAGVPLGSFLSGGIDSSAVTTLLARTLPPPVRSFSIGFAEQHWNEMDYARIAARAAGVEHHEYFVTPEDAFSSVPTLIDAFDEPFANASAIPTYFCALVARRHGVRVLYAGDGGDELFAGNERYTSRRVLDYYDRVPRVLRERVVTPAVQLLAERVPGRVFRRAGNYIRRASLPYPERITSFSVFSYIPLRTLFTDALLDSAGDSWAPSAMLHHHFRAARAHHLLNRELYLDLKLAISDNDILKVTRMARAAGVAVRFPFLDRDLAEFSATVPAGVMMRGGKLRSFFKQAYRDVLPPQVIAKRKHGFGIPISAWLGTHPPFRAMLEDLILSPTALQRGYVRREGVEALLRGHQNDPKGFYGTFLWNLMVLELWHRRVLA